MPVEYYILVFGGVIFIAIGVWRNSLMGKGVGKSEQEALDDLKKEFSTDMEYKKIGDSRNSAVYLLLILLLVLFILVLIASLVSMDKTLLGI